MAGKVNPYSIAGAIKGRENSPTSAGATNSGEQHEGDGGVYKPKTPSVTGAIFGHREAFILLRHVPGIVKAAITGGPAPEATLSAIETINERLRSGDSTGVTGQMDYGRSRRPSQNVLPRPMPKPAPETQPELAARKLSEKDGQYDPTRPVDPSTVNKRGKYKYIGFNAIQTPDESRKPSVPKEGHAPETRSANQTQAKPKTQNEVDANGTQPVGKTVSNTQTDEARAGGGGGKSELRKLKVSEVEMLKTYGLDLGISSFGELFAKSGPNSQSKQHRLNDYEIQMIYDLCGPVSLGSHYLSYDEFRRRQQSKSVA